MKEYSCPHFAQKPRSRVSFAPPCEQKRLRSGTTPGTSVASGSRAGRGDRTICPPPRRRLLRTAPERAERVLRVEGVRPETPAVVEIVDGNAPDDDACGVAPGAPASGARPHSEQ